MPQSKAGSAPSESIHTFFGVGTPAFQGQTVFFEIGVGLPLFFHADDLRRRAEPLDAKAQDSRVPQARPAPRGASTPASISAAVSATTSVSARGQSTPGPTASSKSRKGQLPQRYCSGSRAARRTVSSFELLLLAASGNGFGQKGGRPGSMPAGTAPGTKPRPTAHRQPRFHLTAAWGASPLTICRPPGLRGSTGVTAAMAT